jgi:type IV pilus assembly protein PilM
MSLSSGQSAFAQRTRSLSHALTRAFPTPSLLTPPAAGIDISDSSIKWMVLSPQPETHRVITYGEMPLEQGIVSGGIVRDVAKLSAALRHVRSELGGVSSAHAALPEEAAYVFGMHVPRGTSRQQTLRMIEFEFEDRVPIPPSAAVYDYSVILPRDTEVDDEISVVVFPREVAEAYTESFEKAGITLLSLEIEARSIARAVSLRTTDEPITLLVDFGRARTGFAVVKHGYPIFTSTVEVGGDLMTSALMQSLSLTPEEAESFKNEHGLIPTEGKLVKGLEVVSGVASALADEVARHYHYWDTRRNEKGERMTPVGKVVLIGGSANLHGLPEYIAGRVHAPTEIGNVWQHVTKFEDYVPPIDKRESLQFATAVGLALRGI